MQTFEFRLTKVWGGVQNFADSTHACDDTHKSESVTSFMWHWHAWQMSWTSGPNCTGKQSGRRSAIFFAFLYFSLALGVWFGTLSSPFQSLLVHVFEFVMLSVAVSWLSGRWTVSWERGSGNVLAAMVVLQGARVVKAAKTRAEKVAHGKLRKAGVGSMCWNGGFPDNRYSSPPKLLICLNVLHLGSRIAWIQYKIDVSIGVFDIGTY